jgi:hypothetical protein
MFFNKSLPVQTAQNVKALKRKASMAGGLENPRMYQIS